MYYRKTKMTHSQLQARANGMANFIEERKNALQRAGLQIDQRVQFNGEEYSIADARYSTRDNLLTLRLENGAGKSFWISADAVK